MKPLFSVIFFYCLFLSQAFAQYKYVIYTDQTPPTKANEVKALMENLSPFSQMNMQIEVRSLSTQDLGCATDSRIQRLVVCNHRSLTRRASREGFDQPLVVSDNANYGGSGGGVPVITSSPDVPASIMVHEYMHTLGFCDEYVYSAADLAAYDYCTPRLTARRPNLVRIVPRSEGYRDDQDARRRHRNQIPWFGQIQDSTPISSSTLGTPSEHGNQIGLFRSDMCMNSRRTLHLWRPGSTPTIMEDNGAPIGVLEPILRDVLMSLGMRLRDPSAPAATPTPAHVRVTNLGPCNTGTPATLSLQANENLSDFVSVTNTIEASENPETTEDETVIYPIKRMDSPNPYRKIEDAYNSIKAFGY